MRMRFKGFKLSYIIISALLALVLSACTASKLEPLGADDTILAFGDSLTAGVGVPAQQSYPSVLAELTGLNVINAGIPGETTEEGLERLAEVLEQTQPDLVVLIEGGNDILRNQSEAQMKQNLSAMIRLMQEQGIQVVLLGVPQKALFSDSAPAYQQLADQFNLPFNGDVIAGLLRSPSSKSDQVHFNQKGYRELAEAVYELLEDNGAL